MISLPGQRFFNLLLSREIKERAFRLYNTSIQTHCKALTIAFKLKKANRVSYPENLAISLTTRCNLRCSICDRSNFIPEDMNFDNLFKLRDAIKYAKMIDLTGWGEAILYPKYADTLKYIFSLNKKKRIISQTMNGTFAAQYGDLLRGRLQRLVISLNAAKGSTYNKEMKGADFKKTIRQVEEFLKKLTTEDLKRARLHFVAHKNNYVEMPLFVELARSMNVSQVSFGHYLSNGPDTEKMSLLNIRKEYNDSLKTVEQTSKKYGVEVFYRRFGENLGLSPNNCMFPYNWCFILPNGDMTPCCYLGDINMGNVFRDGFEQVWFGERIQKLRKTRFLPACSMCAPFHPFDSESSHFTARYNIERLVVSK